MKNTEIQCDGDTLYLYGNINFQTVAIYSTSLKTKLNNEIRRIDCSGINQIDSSVISLLLYAFQLTEKRETPLVILNIKEAMLSLIELYGVGDLFQKKY